MISVAYAWRAGFVSITLLLMMLGLGSRLAFLHLGPNPELHARIAGIRQDEEKILIGRGRIFDAQGRLMAIDLPVKDVIADPKVVVESGHLRFTATQLARILELDPEWVHDRLNRPHRRYERIKQYVHQDTIEQIARLKLPGLFFHDASLRNYPHGELMCHVLGFANWNGVGSAGIEQQLDRFLRGRPGLRISERDGARRELYERRSLEIPPQAGADVYLTLDQGLQYLVEEALDKGLEATGAEAGWVIVQRVRTGEILAMCARPAYNPNAFRASTDEQRRNRAISYNFEPGSTFKIGVISAALNESLVRPADPFDCEFGYWMHRGRPLRDYHGYGILSVADVVKKSSNIGTAKIALLLGEKRMEEYLRSFGFGKTLGLDLPGEEGGIFHSRRNWSALSLSRIAMGHEVSATALQMVNAINAIANDGRVMKPAVIKRVVTAEGQTIQEFAPEVLAQPVRPETAELMRRMMARVTGDGGTARRARLEGYTVAGKTGTAQKPIPGRGYSDTENIASFVGFVPAERPEITMMVVLDNPQPIRTGGATAAPLFAEIAGQALRYLDVPPVPPEMAYDINAAPDTLKIGARRDQSSSLLSGRET